MTDGLPRYRSGDRALDAQIAEIADAANVGVHRDLLFEMIVSSLRLTRENDDLGDIKLINAALKELRYSMGVFAPYKDTRKLSIFGSARTHRPTTRTIRLRSSLVPRLLIAVGWSSPELAPALWPPASKVPVGKTALVLA